LKGFETQLSGGAKHTVSLQVLEMFTEAKKLQNEQFHEGDQNTTMVNTILLCTLVTYESCFFFVF